jgi:hypothetical protein
MKWTEGIIARAIAMQHLNRSCFVMVDNCNWTGNECDVLAVTKDLRILDIEIKISRADFKADTNKGKWWHSHIGTWIDGKYQAPEPTRRAWPRKVWKHFYAMPADLWKPEMKLQLASPHSGVLLVRESPWNAGRVEVYTEIRANPDREAQRLTPAEVIDIARLGNLRMWNAYESIGAAA